MSYTAQIRYYYPDLTYTHFGCGCGSQIRVYYPQSEDGGDPNCIHPAAAELAQAAGWVRSWRSPEKFMCCSRQCAKDRLDWYNRTRRRRHLAWALRRGRCGAQTQVELGGSGVCKLDPGHSGPHVDLDDVEWADEQGGEA